MYNKLFGLNKIIWKITGGEKHLGQLRLDDLLMSLGSLKSCLQKIDLHLSKGSQSVEFYKITGLEYGSAEISIEPKMKHPHPKNAEDIVRVFGQSLELIEQNKNLPADFGEEIITAFRDLVSPVARGYLEIEVSTNGTQVNIKQDFEDKIARMKGSEISFEGAIFGHIEALNVHNKREFRIYPIIGPNSIVCDFPEKLFDMVKDGVKRYVKISGNLKRKAREFEPYKIIVDKIKIFPPEDTLPSLSSLEGKAPNMTGGVDSTTFIRSIRDAS